MLHDLQAKTLKKNGRSGGIRTPDILLPKQTRYQAALHSDNPERLLTTPSTRAANREVRIIPIARWIVNDKFNSANSPKNPSP
jgi:CHAD domain-containing protein